MRGLSKVLEQCLLCAAAFNMKKIALHMSRLEPRKPAVLAVAMAGGILALIFRLFRLQMYRYAHT
jgi:hypothetical protein